MRNIKFVLPLISDLGGSGGYLALLNFCSLNRSLHELTGPRAPNCPPNSRRQQPSSLVLRRAARPKPISDNSRGQNPEDFGPKFRGQTHLLTVDCATVSQNEHHARDRSMDFGPKSIGFRHKIPRAKSLNEPAEEQP